MDHLPVIAGPHRPHPEIDYLCSPTFTIPQDPCFETYPQQYGFQPDVLLRKMDFSPWEEWRADSLMQEWFFFVLLADLFHQVDIDFNMSDFIQEGKIRYEGEPARKVVRTTCLPRYLQDWYDRENAHMQHPSTTSMQETKVREAKIFRLIQQSQSAVANLLESRSKYISFGPFMFSIVSIIETIRNAALVVYRFKGGVDNQPPFLPMGIAHWPSRRMINDQSCPNHVQRLQSLLSYTGVYFASALRLPEGAVSFTHSDCEELRCKVNYLNRDTYEPKHKCSSGNCSLVGPDMGKIRHLLEGGQIPILGLSIVTTGTTEEVVFDVLSSEEMPYTAMSHVWSDGRGNLKANTLPTCQIRYFDSILRGLSSANGKHYFWMDTLCVPTKEPLRREAIGLMRRTYQDAAQVLVLDSSLELAPSEAEPEEILMRVQTAGWMRRLWTLQEGALARKLLVRFRESAIDLHLLTQTFEDSHQRHLLSSVTQDALSCVYSFQRFKDLKSTNLLELIRALQWRNTSWQQDETVCLSILLDLDVRQIESTPPGERMAKFLSMVRRVPFGLAFLNGPRLQQPSFRWAPASLMPATGANLPPSNDSVLAVQTTRGLMVEVAGLNLEKMPTSDISWFRIEGDETKYVVRNITQKWDGGSSWTDIKLNTYQNPAIILYGNLASGLDVDRGILVNVTIADERLYRCDYISRVLILREQDEPYWKSLGRTRSTSVAYIGQVERIGVRKWSIQ